MRLTSEQAKQNRQLILETASRMFRLHGMEDVSVADIMKQSGFTHGGFYNHFDSKEELAAEAVACAFEKSAHGLLEKFASARSRRKRLRQLSRNTSVRRIAIHPPGDARHRRCQPTRPAMANRCKRHSPAELNLISIYSPPEWTETNKRHDNKP